MKVLFLTNIPAPYRVDFFEELGSFCDLTVLFERRTANNRNEMWLNNKGSSYKEVYLKGKAIGNESSISFDIIKWLNSKYDIIIIGGYSTLTAMIAMKYLKFKNIPFFANSDGGFIKNDYGIKYIIKKNLISTPTYWLSSGKGASDYLVHYGAERDRVYEYPFTSLRDKDILKSNINNTEKVKIRKELNIKLKNVILMAGHINHGKGIDILLDSAKALPQYNFYIAGGQITKEYLNIINEQNIRNVTFLGFKSKNELKRYYYASDLFILPTRDDVWGLVINEAMAFGLPVITTNRCGAGLELVKDGINGNIISIDNRYELSEKIQTIMEDDVYREKMSQNSIEAIQKYTIENMTKEHIKIFKNVIEKEYKEGSK